LLSSRGVQTMTITTDPPAETNAFPASRKVYAEGSQAGVRVPMREITLSPTEGITGPEPNPPMRVYDTSGIYTDPDRAVDIREGLPALRERWIRERGDVEEYDGRAVTPDDNGLKPDDPRANLEVFPGLRRSTLRAKAGGNVSQMHYARRGMITPEMEFIAIREGTTPEVVRDEVARGRAIIPAHVHHPE